MGVPFVGRRDELASLRGLITRARREPGPVAALISGEPGSGKSRLLREALADIEPRRQIVLTGFEPTESIELAAVADLLRRLAKVPGHGPRLRDLAFGESSTSGDRALQVFEAANQALVAFGPIVVAIDDLQWVDSRSFALVHYLLKAASSDGRPLAVIVASRPAPVAVSFMDGVLGHLGDGRTASIELGGLGLDDGITLVRHLDGRLDIRDAEALWRRAAGVPFWLEALARARGPADAADVVADRLRALGPDAVALLSALAVAARPFDRGALAVVLEWREERLDHATRELLGRGIALEEGGEVRLAHDLIRETAAKSVPTSTARALHARLADVLERLAGENVQLLAEALDHRATAGLPTAGLAARLVDSPQRRLVGEEQLRRVSSIADTLPAGASEQLDLDRGIGRLAAEVGEQDLALRHWSRVATNAGDARLRLRGHIEAARAAWEAGSSVDAHAHIDRARSLSAEGFAAVELDAIDASVALDLDSDTARGAETAERGLARARGLMAAAGGPDRLASEDRSVVLAIVLVAAKAAWKQERAEDLVALIDSARSMADGLGDEARLNASLYGAWALLQLGRYTVAEPYARAAFEASERLLLPGPRSEAGLLLARLLYGLGRLAEAEALTRATDELQRRIHPWPLGELSKALQATVELSMDVPGALQRFAAVAPTVDDHQKISLHQAVAVWVSRRDGLRSMDEADTQLAAARSAAEVTGCPRCAGELRAVSVEVLARTGRLDEAGRELASWESGLRGEGHVARQLWQAQAHAALGMATGDADASLKLEALAQAYEAAGWLLDAQWTRLDLGRVLARSGDRPAAISAYASAAVLARRTGSAGVERHAARALRELGVRAWRRGPGTAATSGVEALSDRELEVTRLVARGATNAEVAESLAISPKTVERHLTNILAKVGARNRTELSARLQGGGTGFPR
jgi:DNA-binding CsgD family transcriptional regulator